MPMAAVGCRREADVETDLGDRLDEVLSAGRAAGLHGLVVLRDGRPVLERYGAGEDFSWNEPLGRVTFGPDVLHDIRSVTKSIVALLYGIALADGLVPEPTEPLLSRFPEYADLAEDGRRASITVEHALTMTLGLEWNENVPYTSEANSEIAMESAPDRHRFALDRPIVKEPGRRWRYNGGASALIGRLVVKGTGVPLPDFAREALFRPLGISTFAWMTGADGVASAASGLRLTPRDLARIGQAVLDDDGRVIPAAWLRTALRPHVRIADDFDYGYQWYLGTFPSTGVRWAGGMGNGGQRLYVLPDLGVVVAITAGDYDSADQAATPSIVMDDVVLAGVR
jgi:CubicO group peptidase (beta-lactamase class C family)